MNQNTDHTPTSAIRIPFPSKALRILGWVGGVMLVAGLGFLKFDVVVHAEGAVEGQSMNRIYAPRGGRIVEIPAQSGGDVNAGDVLFVLEDEGLDLEIYETRQQLVEMETELFRTQNRLRELALVGSGFETHVARVLHPLREEEMELLEEVSNMYVTLREGGSGSRMEEIQFALRRLTLRQQHLREALRLELEEAGWLDLLKEKETREMGAVQQRIELLEARIAQLEASRARLHVKAPHAGRVTRVRFRDAGAHVEAGEHLLSLYQPEDGYVARMFVADRNVDLIHPGLPVRLDSTVFSSSAEGYMTGTVLELIRDEQASDAGGFEVWVSLDHSPVPPVMGSRLKGEILLQQQGWLGLLRRSPLRERHTETASATVTGVQER